MTRNIAETGAGKQAHFNQDILYQFVLIAAQYSSIDKVIKYDIFFIISYVINIFIHSRLFCIQFT